MGDDILSKHDVDLKSLGVEIDSVINEKIFKYKL